MKGWLLLAGLPLVPVVLALSLVHDDLWRECAQRQFVNCYVSAPLFIGFAILMTGAFIFSARLGASPVRAVAARPLRFGVFALILAVLGAEYLEIPILSHAWFGWSQAKRLEIMGTNLAIVAVAATAFQVLFPFGGSTVTRPAGKVGLGVAIGFWAYLFASLFRMAFTVGVE